MFRRSKENVSKSSRKIWIRKDLFISHNKAKKDTEQVVRLSDWHVPQDGVNYELWKKETQPHVRRLFTETIPFGRIFQALDAKSQLGYEGDNETNNPSDDDTKDCSPKRRKIYYDGKIGGPIQTSPSYKYYTPASPYYCPSEGNDIEWPTFSYNPFKSDGETTDDDYDNNSNNNSNKNNNSSNNKSSLSNNEFTDEDS